MVKGRRFRVGRLLCNGCGSILENYPLNDAPSIRAAGSHGVYPCPLCWSLNTTWIRRRHDGEPCEDYKHGESLWCLNAREDCRCGYSDFVI